MKTKLIFTYFFMINFLYSQQDVFKLLDLPKGYPLWSQSISFEGNCTKPYNILTPTSNDNDCPCDHYLLGCGAIAMGQIMWYWEYPTSYEWDTIPKALHDNTSDDSAEELQKLLYDCAEEMNMHYQCAGSWAYTNDVLQAFHNKGYKAATIYDKSEWNNQDWATLVRTELDVGRPVFIRGGEIIDWGDWGNVHYFIIDGYDRNNINKFHFNFGWGNNTNTVGYNNTNNEFVEYTSELNNLLTYNNLDNYSEQQQIIIGISPICEQIPNDIIFVPYHEVVNNKDETAINSISLPIQGFPEYSDENSNNNNFWETPTLYSTLNVESGGNLELIAGKSIKLNKGFHAKNGSNFKAKIRNNSACSCGGEISVSSWTNFFSPFNNDGKNDNLCIPVTNANTYTIEIFDREGFVIYSGSGKVNSNPVCVWNGEGLQNSSYFIQLEDNYVECSVVAIITFFNNCGQKEENSYVVTAIFPENNTKNKIALKNKNTQFVPIVYPNPTNGIAYLDLTKYTKNIKYPILANVKSVTNANILTINMFDNKIDLRNLAKGIYFISFKINNEIFSNKIIIN